MKQRKKDDSRPRWERVGQYEISSPYSEQHAI